MAGEVSFKSEGLELLWVRASRWNSYHGKWFKFFRKSERMSNLYGKVETDAIQSSSSMIQVYEFQIYASNPLKKALKLLDGLPLFQRLRATACTVKGNGN